MFGHVADRDGSSRWLILSFLFATALAWSFAMMQNRGGESRLSLGTTLAVALGLSTLRVGVMLIGSKRRRRERKAERHADGELAETDGEEASAEEPRPTYDDVFGVAAGSDGPTDQAEPADDDAAEASGGDDESHGEAVEISGDVAQGSDESNEEAGAISDEVETGDADVRVMSESDGLEQVDVEVDEPAADVEAIRSELESEEAVRRLREEFKTRAQEAELRIQQRQAELDQASVAPTSA